MAMPRRAKKELRNFTRSLRLVKRSIRLNIPSFVSRSLCVNPGDRLEWSLKSGILWFRIGSGPNKFFLQGRSLYCTVPMNLAKSAGYWDGDWVRLNVYRDDYPLAISLSRAKPPPPGTFVRDRWKEEEREWDKMVDELRRIEDDNKRLKREKYELEFEVRRLRATVRGYKIGGSFSDSWWLEKLDKMKDNVEGPLKEKFAREFGKEWWLNPYFIASSVEFLNITPSRNLEAHFAGLLANFDLDDPGIDRIEVEAYRPVLEMVKSGMSLAEAVASNIRAFAARSSGSSPRRSF